MNGYEWFLDVERNRVARQNAERELAEVKREIHIGDLFLISFAIAAIVAALLVLLSCAPSPLGPGVAKAQAQQDYPRLFSYHGGRSWGPPFTKPDGSLDSALIRQAARWPVITLNPNAATLRPDMVQCFRFYNQNITILFYMQFAAWHIQDTSQVIASTDQSMYAEWHRELQRTHGWVHTADIQYRVDWSQKDVADALIAILVKYTKYHLADGWFFDYFEPAFSWTGNGTVDDDANRVFHAQRLIDALHAAQPGCLVMGNGESALRVKLDGRMKEGFTTSITPFDEAFDLRPGDVLKSEAPIGSGGNAKLARYTLATACMSGAMSNHGNSHYTGAPEEATWWFPEYAVDPQGKPDPTGKYVGWLGKDEGAATRTPAASWLRRFEHGAVVTRSNFSSGSETVQLGGQYKRIGSTTNVTSVSISAGDAVFLWR
jgi:hypothetical protein